MGNRTMLIGKLCMPVAVRQIIKPLRTWGVVLMAAALAAVGLIAVTTSSDRQGLQAQQNPGVPPTFPAIVFNGHVTINGEQPTYSGFRITARIGDKYESAPVIEIGRAHV